MGTNSPAAAGQQVPISNCPPSPLRPHRPNLFPTSRSKCHCCGRHRLEAMCFWSAKCSKGQSRTTSSSEQSMAAVAVSDSSTSDFQTRQGCMLRTRLQRTNLRIASLTPSRVILYVEDFDHGGVPLSRLLIAASTAGRRGGTHLPDSRFKVWFSAHSVRRRDRRRALA